MDKKHSSTSHTKGQHLTAIDRGIIKAYLHAKIPTREIAERTGYHCSTIYREIKRNQRVRAYGNSTSYDPIEGQIKADENKARHNYPLKYQRCLRFIDFVSKHFNEDNWSFDVCYHSMYVMLEPWRADLSGVKSFP